ncbi:hypothetical protein BC936DRAFT_138774 [Jimgerdemannia flammicorona]|uniref:Uncharacterized protein n=1 Tax=Jimgerdemannia flammicorona TaxID=994334 RepID=A0A433DI32_9FUNG|nr:hypothetical protein BC936DRAFT_138774 [Jimgerdemannia flammicorona]
MHIHVFGIPDHSNVCKEADLCGMRGAKEGGGYFWNSRFSWAPSFPAELLDLSPPPWTCLHGPELRHLHSYYSLHMGVPGHNLRHQYRQERGCHSILAGMALLVTINTAFNLLPALRQSHGDVNLSRQQIVGDLQYQERQNGLAVFSGRIPIY